MIFIADLKTNSWEVVYEDEPYWINYKFSFVNGEDKLVEFDNLFFGLEILDLNVKIEYPQNGVSYISSDQKFLEFGKMYGILPETKYVVKFWASNNSILFQDEFEYEASRPACNFPSWTWNNELKFWQAPVDPPECCDDYEWNEETLSWDIVTS